MADMSPITLARFWSKVEVGNEADCWPWRSGVNAQGYGRFGKGKAHRVAYEVFKGEIPEGLLICHRCDNPACCNPYHLFVGSHQDNSNDAVGKGRLASGERHPFAKLTSQQVDEIRSSPLTGQALAELYGVSKSTISGIRTFRHRLTG